MGSYSLLESFTLVFKKIEVFDYIYLFFDYINIEFFDLHLMCNMNNYSNLSMCLIKQMMGFFTFSYSSIYVGKYF